MKIKPSQLAERIHLNHSDPSNLSSPFGMKITPYDQNIEDEDDPYFSYCCAIHHLFYAV